MGDLADQSGHEQAPVHILPSIEFLYRSWERRLHWTLGGMVVLDALLLFLQNQATVLIALGTVALTLSVMLLLLIIIGGELWAPRVPQDVWREAQRDKLFRSQAGELDETFRK